MEVIKNNGVPKIQRACWCCGSVLSFTRDDVETRTYRDMSGDTDSETWVTCPVCDSHIPISYKDERTLAYDEKKHGKKRSCCSARD